MQYGKIGYSAAAKSLHWIVALIVVCLIPVGAVMGDLPKGALQNKLFTLHESFGMTVLALMGLRLAIRLRETPPPDAALTRKERMISRTVHYALYLLLLLTPLLGWLALSAYGLGPSLFGFSDLPALLGKNDPLSKVLFTWHGRGGFLLAGLVILHIAGFFRHPTVMRKNLVSRMLWVRQSS
jgi:cytochrome b561